MVERHTDVVSKLTLHHYYYAADVVGGSNETKRRKNNFTVDYQATAHSLSETREEPRMDEFTQSHDDLHVCPVQRQRCSFAKVR